MTTHYEARQYCSPDTLSAAAHYVDREYGCYGYRIGLALSGGSVSVFEVRCSDGASFNICADKWGNVERISDDATLEQAEIQIRNMSRNMSRKACAA